MRAAMASRSMRAAIASMSTRSTISSRSMRAAIWLRLMRSTIRSRSTLATTWSRSISSRTAATSAAISARMALAATSCARRCSASPRAAQPSRSRWCRATATDPRANRHRGTGQDPQRPPQPARDGARRVQRASLRLDREAERGGGQQPRHVDPTTSNRRRPGQPRPQPHQRPLAVLHLGFLQPPRTRPRAVQCRAGRAEWLHPFQVIWTGPPHLRSPPSARSASGY